MTDNFESARGKVALITGGASGIGLALAKRLVDLGSNVVITDLPSSNGKKLAEDINAKSGMGISIIFVPADVTKLDELRAVFAKAVEVFGRLDVVCNNAGVAIPDENLKTSGDAWKKIIDINFTAVLAGTKLAVEYMQKNKPNRGGIIINTGSLAGLYPQQNQPVYSATKGGVVHFTRSCASLSETDNIKVLAMCPGFVDTPLLNDAIREFAKGTQNGQLLTTEIIVEGFVDLITNKKYPGGTVMRVTQQKGIELPPSFNVRSKY